MNRNKKIVILKISSSLFFKKYNVNLMSFKKLVKNFRLKSFKIIITSIYKSKNLQIIYYIFKTTRKFQNQKNYYKLTT